MCLSVCDDLQGAMGKKQKEEPAEEAEEEVEDPDMSESQRTLASSKKLNFFIISV